VPREGDDRCRDPRPLHQGQPHPSNGLRRSRIWSNILRSAN